MAFDGDLESLPIPDLIQLLHATGKSGTLTLRGAKGESQLVFDAGYIVSANHVNNSMRIGRILVDMGALTAEELEQALKAQATAGRQRAPLVATLLEGGTILPPQAYKGLEILIELTIVEVLTWNQGTFSFDVTKTFVSDEYRYFPENLEQQILLNTQSVLMDALRIYDERKRDGTLMDATFFAVEEEATVLSPEDLGLDALDELERVPPEPFHGLADQGGAGTVRQRLKGALAGVAPEEEERLVRYLEEGAEQSAVPEGIAVFLLSRDPLTVEMARAACGERLLRTAAREEELAPVLDREGGAPRRIVLIGADLAAPEVAGVQGLAGRVCGRFPAAEGYLLLETSDHQLFARSVQSGIRGVIPWRRPGGAAETLVGDIIASCDALRHTLCTLPALESAPLPPHFLKLYRELPQLSTPAEITLSVLRFVSGFLPRAVTFVQLRGELVAEKGIGFGAAGAVSSVKLRIPLDHPSLLRDVVEGGEAYYGEADDFVRHSFAMVGAPASHVLLLPIQSMGRVVAVLYADWGEGRGGETPLPFLQIMAQHAGLALDNALYRKRLAQGGGQRNA